MKTYMLIMSLFNPISDQWDSYAIDLNMSAEECIDSLNSFTVVHNIYAIFACEGDSYETRL